VNGEERGWKAKGIDRGYRYGGIGGVVVLGWLLRNTLLSLSLLPDADG
jgi:hypothetical protein